MKKTIWKFELETKDGQEIHMPAGAEILTVQTQGTNPCMWALVDPEEKNQIRYFEVFEIGHSINFGMGVGRNYVGTYQLMGGSLVFHVFERLN